MKRVLALSFVISLGLMVRDGQRANAADKLEYNRDIRPILSNTCFACHGPDAGNRQSGLRLDRRDGATRPADSGSAAIVPGNSSESELIARITSTDPDVKMPPEEGIKKLSPQQIVLLKRWIDEGAEYQGHWSFLPIQKPATPELGKRPAKNGLGEPRISGEIDRFIVAELRSQGLGQSPAADPVTLARRVAFDLNGLPPSPEQLAAFAADPSDANYEKLVDELLASPRYGERMAMWWLDLVRYADSVGYHGDQSVSVFPFREYVIQAFNSNKRFDEFTREQLGGDLLPNPTLDQKVAAGYNRLGMMTEEGGAQAKEYLAKYAAERVRNIGGAWLGLTTGCCECHDHKFDPLKSKDFYQLEAFFADISERGVYSGNDYSPKMPVPTPQQAAELARLDAEIGTAKNQLEAAAPEVAAAQVAWERSLTADPTWTPLLPAKAEAVGKSVLAIQADQSILASGEVPATDTYKITFANAPAKITAIQLEALTHDSLPAKGPGRADNGNFVLSEITVNVRGEDGAEQPVPLTNPSVTFEQTNAPGLGISFAIDGDATHVERGWGIYLQTSKPQTAVFETKADVGIAPGQSLVVELAFNSKYAKHILGHFRLSASSAARPIRTAANGLPGNISAIAKLDPTQRSDAQKKELATYYETISPVLVPLKKQLAEAQKRRNDYAGTISTMLATIATKPRTIRILPRGNWMDDSGEVVQPAVPAFLPQPPAKEGPLNRLDLANWLVSKENPLVARTLVNRLWKNCFGAGLSRKLDDLGAQGEWPSHPQLLDWLATDLIDHGWDLKRTLKQIVMSATYRQSSLVPAALREADPFNRLLARQGRFRFDAETVRDNALWISGLLVEKLGGPSVKPYQPPRYWAYLNFPEREWQNDSGDKLYRRGLYTHWQRQYLHPSLLAFDAPSREECTAVRVRSNTPLKALVLLNDPTYVEAARVFAELIMHNGGSSPAERLDYALRRALSRPPRPAEAQVLLPLYEKHLRQYSADTKAANELLSVGARPKASDLDAAELAAWTNVARAILNLHATITRN
jgi:hypothetical protein